MTQAMDNSRGALRGSSGATFRTEHEYRQVVKSGDNRVGQQGRYIESFGRNTTLPSVYGTGTFSYRMELLSDPSPLAIIDPFRLTIRYIEMLSKTIWCHSAETLYDEHEHFLKIGELTQGDYTTFIQMTDFHSTIDWGSLSSGRTHGDPTFDNLMHRRNGDLVIIDPLPPTQAVPDLVSKDVGKIMMSLVGFESVRYGTGHHDAERSVEALMYIREEFGEHEYRASLYWCAVHLLRAIPYMPTQEVKDGISAMVREVLARVRS